MNRLDEPIFIAVSKPLLTEFGIHHRLESCVKECLIWQISVDFNDPSDEASFSLTTSMDIGTVKQ